jgi:hypothetical protein
LKQKKIKFTLPRVFNFCLAAKLQKGGRHIQFAKNQPHKLNEKKLACGSGSFSFLTPVSLDFNFVQFGFQPRVLTQIA